MSSCFIPLCFKEEKLLMLLVRKEKKTIEGTNQNLTKCSMLFFLIYFDEFIVILYQQKNIFYRVRLNFCVVLTVNIHI